MGEHRRAPAKCAECGMAWPCPAEAARAEQERNRWTAPCAVCGTRQPFGSPDKAGRVRLLTHRRRVVWIEGVRVAVQPDDDITNKVTYWTVCPGSRRTAHPGSD